MSATGRLRRRLLLLLRLFPVLRLLLVFPALFLARLLPLLLALLPSLLLALSLVLVLVLMLALMLPLLVCCGESDGCPSPLPPISSTPTSLT